MPAAVPVVASVAGGLIAANGAKSAANSANQAMAKANEGDPRKNAFLYGDANSGGGLLAQFQKLGAQEQGAGLRNYGESSDHYLGSYGQTDMQKMRDTAGGLQGGGDLASIQAWSKGNMIDAPAQNNLNLAPAYQNMIYGDAGANPYLNKALQGSMDQSKNVFDQMQGNATDNLQRNILPGIRSNAVLTGQYGGSRQGVAEGTAIGDFAKAQQQTINQFGQNNTDAAVGAQAGAFESGQNRSLSAMQGLGAQQYGVAQQNAQTKNQAEFMNVDAVNGVGKFNAQLSGANKVAGLGAQQGLLGQTLQGATNQDNYGLNKAGMTNGLLQPYLSNNPALPTPYQPNTGAAAMSGAMGGLGLLNAFNQASPSPRPDGMGTGLNYNYQPSQLPINTGALQNLNFLNNIGGK